MLLLANSSLRLNITFTPGCGEYSDIRIYSNIFRYEYSFVSYSYNFFDANIFGYSFVLVLALVLILALALALVLVLGDFIIQVLRDNQAWAPALRSFGYTLFQWELNDLKITGSIFCFSDSFENAFFETSSEMQRSTRLS